MYAIYNTYKLFPQADNQNNGVEGEEFSSWGTPHLLSAFPQPQDSPLESNLWLQLATLHFCVNKKVRRPVYTLHSIRGKTKTKQNQGKGHSRTRRAISESSFEKYQGDEMSAMLRMRSLTVVQQMPVTQKIDTNKAKRHAASSRCSKLPVLDLWGASFLLFFINWGRVSKAKGE
jgi:hypothetical protein